VTQHEHPFHYYRSPADIREVQFSHRIRGVDEYEVAEFLDLLADQVQATDLEMRRLREENDHLRAENEHLRTESRPVAAALPAATGPEGNPQAASLLLNAQRVADDLVEEAVRRTREMLTVARAERSAILRNAQEAAAAMLIEARESPSVKGAHSSRLESPRYESPSPQPSSPQPPRYEPPRYEPPRYEPPLGGSSSYGSPPTDSPLYESSLRDTQRHQASRAEAPRHASPRYEPPEPPAEPTPSSPPNLSIARQRTWQLDGQAAV
jgi:DivIVA domain-containing protein